MNPERRRSPRVRAPEGAEGVIRSTIQVQVEDISGTGVRFQLSGPVRPGSTYAFQADLGGYELSVPIRVTRCKAAPRAGGSPGLVYQAGAEFLWDSPDAEAHLAEWLDERGPAGVQFRAKLE